MKKKYILNFTPTGMIPTKEMTPLVPILPQEIVEDVTQAIELGANMVYLHARDPETLKPAYQKEIYAEIIQGIKKVSRGVIICVSTSGKTFGEFEKRSQVLELQGELKPDSGSLTLSSLNFNKQVSINHPDMIKDLAAKMLANGIRPELEVFDLGMINFAKYLIRKKLIKPPYYVNLILGNIACAQANVHSFSFMTRELPENTYWSAGGIGNYQLQTNAMALLVGGGVRIGLEDNIWYDEEHTHLATNAELVKRIVKISKALGMAPYSPNEARQLLEC